MQNSMFFRAVAYAFLFALTVSLNIPFCYDPPTPNVPFFFYTVNGTKDNTTKAYVCHDDNFLYVHWWNIDEQVISTYKNCNDPLYNEDAVEIFIATGTSYPTQYFELEVSPSGNLFFADITNPSGYCSNLGTKYYSCSQAVYSGKKTATGWQATLKLDLTLIGRGKKLTYFKGNMFRIDKSSSKATRYLAYVPSNTSPACFHQPKFFEDFVLVYE